MEVAWLVEQRSERGRAVHRGPQHDDGAGPAGDGLDGRPQRSHGGSSDAGEEQHADQQSMRPDAAAMAARRWLQDR
jgi:hypothetical protein